MASSKRKKYTPHLFESTGAKNDTSANIYTSMLTSSAYKRLSPRQKQLYVVCKDQFYGKRKPRSDYPDIEMLQSDLVFYLNFSLVRDKYGLYTEYGQKEFAKDKRALVENGFLELVSDGSINRRRSIYKFSDRWHRDATV